MTIEIKGVRVNKRVRAKRFGFLVIHKTFGEDALFTVTHVPTGLCLLHSMLHGDAIEYAKCLQVLDWNFKDPKAGRKLYPQAKKILDELVRERHPTFSPPN